MPGRPYIDIKLPSFVHPGDAVKVGIKLESSSRTSIEFIAVTLTGTQGAKEREDTQYTKRTVVDEATQVSGEMVLEEGQHSFEASLTLPDDAPSSYTGFLSDIQYSVGVHVSIPWWPDAKEHSDLVVAPRPAPRPKQHAITAVGQEPERPFLELALDDRCFAPGEEITGALALGNVRGRRVDGISLSLVGTERIRVTMEGAHEAHRTTSFLKASADDEGAAIPFRFRVPRDVTPSFDAGMIALTWGFEARVLGINTATAQTLPVVIGAFQGSPSAERRRPRIGSGRWRDVWVEAAAHAGLALDDDDLVMSGSMHGCQASVSIAREGEHAGALSGELSWPSWEIGLRVARGSLTERVFGAEEDTLGPYRIEGHERAQVRAAVSERLRAALLAFDGIEMDDGRAVVNSRWPAHEPAALRAFIERLLALAAAVREASAGVSPPSSMASIAPSWAAFAGEVGGRLVLGSMCVRGGSLEGESFDIETHFAEQGAEPSFTRITLAIDPPLAKPFDPESAADMAAAPPGTREIVGSIRKHARSLRATEDRIEADADDPLAPPARLLEPMRQMAALAARLRGERRIGPYR